MHLLLLLALLSNLIIAAGPVSAASLLDQKDYSYWKKILHYNDQNISRADGTKFFLSPIGKSNPEAELMATIAAFKNPNATAGWFNYHPQCVFRERFFFLKNQGLLENVPEVSCPEFLEWKDGLNTESVSLIFSSSYPNNPSSLFGHTLLRLNQKKVDGKKQDLLDYAVAFSAVPEHDDLGVVFAAKGMFGGYKGLFEITKYYTKVNEYNNGESRDLIEYNLSMTPAELDRMINHLWELYQTTYFDYYFTDENCSAVLADLLAVAYKEDDRVNAHARWYYLPGEMVKHFSQLKGRIESITYRPSLKKQVAKQFEKLSANELKEVKEIVSKKALPENLMNTNVLDSVISFLDFTQYRTKNKLEGEEATLQRSALIKRSKLPKAENFIETYDQNNKPEFSHDPQKFSFFSRLENKHFQTGIEFKQGYHDLMSRDLGFDTFSQFDFLVGSFLYDFKLKKINIDELILVNLASLHEYRFYDPQLSWKARVGIDRIYDFDCTHCLKLNLSGLGGLTLRSQSDQSVFNLMAGIAGETASEINKAYRLGPLFEVSFYSLVSPLSENLKIGLSNEIRFDATKKIRSDFYNQINMKTSYALNQNSDLRLEQKVVSRFGSLTKQSTIYEIKYGHFF